MQWEVLPVEIKKQAEKVLRYLATNPRHPSLQTHIVKSSTGDYGGKIFEAYVSKQYRLTLEYGAERIIVLRNIDNHDECLENP